MGELKDKKNKSNKKDKQANGKSPATAAVPAKKSASNKEDSASKISKSKSKGKGKETADGEVKDGLDEAGVLLREIKSLGGNQEDFDFLKDVDTDDEELIAQQGASAEDKSLAKDIKSFMASLGDFSALAEASDEDVEDGEEEEEEDEEAEGEDEEDEEEAVDEDDDEEAEVETEHTANAIATASTPVAVEGSSSEEESSDSEDEPAQNTTSTVLATSTASTSAPKPSQIINRSGMLVDPNPLWYEIEMPSLPEVEDDVAPVSSATISQLHSRASQLLTTLSDTFTGSLNSNDNKSNPLTMSSTLTTSDRAFISQILQSGTSSDKLSALILLTSSSPIHTVPYITQLLNLTKKKSRDEAVRAIRAIVDWLKGGQGGSGSAAGLPDRKLRWFNEQPGLKNVVKARQGITFKKDGRLPGDEHLLLWAFEDWLKKWYFELLQNIEVLSHDPLPFVRTQMTGFLAALLASKPEQEQNLLHLLVDKLGDSDRTVSSRTSYHLLQLLQAHPMMKTIVVREVAAIVLRPAIAPVQVSKKGKATANGTPSVQAGIRSVDHSKYYGIITLNQIMLSRSQQDTLVANKLIEVYFDIFRDLLGVHGDDEEEKGGALGQEGELKDRKRRRDEKKHGKGKQDDKFRNLARKERRKLEKSQQALEAESKMMAAVLTGVNRAFPYSDIDGNLLHKRVDTLFRIIHTGTFNVCIQALMLIYQVSAKQQSVSDRFYRVLYETLVDPRLASCSKQAMYLNLLFKAIKADTSSKRQAAFVKRLTQILSVHQPPFVCGALYLLGELFSLTPGLRSMLSEPEDVEDDVENFKDAPESSGSEEDDVDASAPKVPSPSSGTQYDGKKRDPQFANASNSCLWELVPLLSHFHPSVALHASQLLVSAPITTTPDLELHTLSHFLDRFVYKNAKKHAGGKDSIMKPGAKGLDRSGMVVMRKGANAIAEDRVNADDFINKTSEQVPVDQRFFHIYFNQKVESEKAKETKKDKKKRKRAEDEDDMDEDDVDIDGLDESSEEEVRIEDDEEEENESLDEDEVWKAMQASMPDAGEDDADLLEDSDDDDIDEDDEDLAQYDYADSDSELGVDEELGEAMDGEDGLLAIDDDVEEDEEEGDDEDIDVDDQEVQEDEDEPQSFFQDEDDDDELAGFAEEDDDVLGSDEDIELGEGIELPSTTTSKSQDRRNKKRKLKHLPAFASADDWAHLLGDDSD